MSYSKEVFFPIFFLKGHHSALNILYLTEIAIVLEIFMMGLLLQQDCHNRCHISLPKNYPYMTNDTGNETHTS